MEYLFDSRGRHIANFVKGQLYGPSGRNIGHFLDGSDIFIDMSGRYLGELVHGDRLLYRTNSPYRSTNFGNYGNYGNIGNYGNPGNRGSIGSIAGFADVPQDRLQT